MHRTKVSRSFDEQKNSTSHLYRFAWMEILKAVAVLFKLFDTERVNKKPTIIREGFFNKTSECECVIRLRHEGTLTEKELE